jgi:hypothetical protein
MAGSGSIYSPTKERRGWIPISLKLAPAVWPTIRIAPRNLSAATGHASGDRKVVPGGKLAADVLGFFMPEK